MQWISRYSYSILLIHWGVLHFVVKQKLHVNVLGGLHCRRLYCDDGTDSFYLSNRSMYLTIRCEMAQKPFTKKQRQK